MTPTALCKFSKSKHRAKCSLLCEFCQRESLYAGVWQLTHKCQHLVQPSFYRLPLQQPLVTNTRFHIFSCGRGRTLRTQLGSAWIAQNCVRRAWVRRDAVVVTTGARMTAGSDGKILQQAGTTDTKRTADVRMDFNPPAARNSA